MVVQKRRKSVRMRGSGTHGWGAMKKHRGSGNRGGKGNAGSGKRADSKKPSNWDESYFGKKGFTYPQAQDCNTINIITIEERIQPENGLIDLTKLGYDKLLSTGKVTKKHQIQVRFASKKAIEKIEKMGGKVVLDKA